MESCWALTFRELSSFLSSCPILICMSLKTFSASRSHTVVATVLMTLISSLVISDLVLIVEMTYLHTCIAHLLAIYIHVETFSPNVSLILLGSNKILIYGALSWQLTLVCSCADYDNWLMQLHFNTKFEMQNKRICHKVKY